MLESSAHGWPPRYVRVHQRVGSKDDHIGGVLEQVGRKCWRAQLMGGHKGTLSLLGGRSIIVRRLRDKLDMKKSKLNSWELECLGMFFL
jgi:hypothetical protein